MGAGCRFTARHRRRGIRPARGAGERMELLRDLLFDYTMRTVALGAGALGVVAGALGTFAVLRRQSLLGDAISHAALPGIVLAFMLTGTKSPLALVLGAAVAGGGGAPVVVGGLPDPPP